MDFENFFCCRPMSVYTVGGSGCVFLGGWGVTEREFAVDWGEFRLGGERVECVFWLGVYC